MKISEDKRTFERIKTPSAFGLRPSTTPFRSIGASFLTSSPQRQGFCRRAPEYVVNSNVEAVRHMSFISETGNGAQDLAVSIATPGDYIALLKPRVMSLVIFTALTGMLIAPTHVNPIIAFASLLAIAVGAGASGALNMWYDADIDAVMRRTKKRPIPAGRVTKESAFSFGAILTVLSVLTLGFVANWLAAALLAFTIFFYVVIYTMWLKRSTPQNIVIGGAAGAFPPMVGYLAVTGHVSLASLTLFAIIFVWTPPHFWALALVKADDFARAGIPMLPNVKGADRTRRDIQLYAFILAPLGLAPWLIGFASPVYGLLAFVLGVLMLFHAARVYLVRDGDQANRFAMRMFAFSIIYLFLLFAEIVGERTLAMMQIAAPLSW
ncbi:Protoheme IX farnesyltransferase [Methylocella tundrae]|nr:Protoheme IX farnesyltransferase [Methylocella tundrae]